MVLANVDCRMKIPKIVEIFMTMSYFICGPLDFPHASIFITPTSFIFPIYWKRFSTPIRLWGRVASREILLKPNSHRVAGWSLNIFS